MGRQIALTLDYTDNSVINLGGRYRSGIDLDISRTGLNYKGDKAEDTMFANVQVTQYGKVTVAKYQAQLMIIIGESETDISMEAT